MNYFHGKPDFQMHSTCITIGKFDGIHMGHRKLFDCMNRYKEEGMTTLMLTFDYNPSNLFSNKESDVIYTESEKIHLLERIPLDIVVFYPFTIETANMAAEDFVKEILIKSFDMKILIIGNDFRFGRGRYGDAAFLEELSRKLDFKLVICDKELSENKEISSTRIRNLLREGNIKSVNEMLGSPYFIMGNVVHGKGIGGSIAVPTANILPQKNKLLPSHGVYVTNVITESKRYRSITNIGYNPTVNKDDNSTVSIETYLFDCSENLYGKDITIEFYCFIREEKKFLCVEELKKQIEKDIIFSKNYTLQIT